MQQHLGVEQLRLPRLADLGQQEVAAVADLLLGGELAVLGDRHALVLPGVEAAAHRDDVLVAQLLQDAAGEQRARAAGAVGDDRRRSCRAPSPRRASRGSRAAARPRPGGSPARNSSLLAHVEQHGLLAVREPRLHLVGRDLGHLLPGFRHDLLVGLRHSSTLDTVKEIHAILEPARHAGSVRRRTSEPRRSRDCATADSAARAAADRRARPRKQLDLLPVGTPEQPASPERPAGSPTLRRERLRVAVGTLQIVHQRVAAARLEDVRALHQHLLGLDEILAPVAPDARDGRRCPCGSRRTGTPRRTCRSRCTGGCRSRSAPGTSRPSDRDARRPRCGCTSPDRRWRRGSTTCSAPSRRA